MSSIIVGIVLGFVVAYIIFSFGTVKADEVAMLSFFDRPVRNLHKGLYFAPWGIYSVKKERGTEFQDELPADPENIFRQDDKEKVPPGMFPPIRVKFGSPDPNDPEPLKSDPYNIAMVAEVVPVVSWRIEDPCTFFQVLGSVENCKKILTDKAVEVFGDEFSRVTPAKASLELAVNSQKLENKLVAETTGGRWGIKVTDAYIKPFIFSHGLNTAVVEVKIADQAARATVITAGAERVKRREEATGTAEGVLVLSDADRQRLIRTGLAKADASGNITELVPEANVKAIAEALGGLKNVKGTLVLGDIKTMLGIEKGGKQ